MRKPDLSKLSLGGAAAVPTMIVPPGTQIAVDAQGQISIRTPGNLVLQNSGAYAVLESVSGSIRIEPSVHVEAVTVRCADTCLVQGSLTAWRVVAHTLHVDSDAEAHVVMQETERLEVGKSGRLVGNFKSEKELFELFSRFAGHVRALPAPAHLEGATTASVTVVAEVAEVAELVDRAAADMAIDHPGALRADRPGTTPGEQPEVVDVVGDRATTPGGSSQQPDALCLAMLLLEQAQQQLAAQLAASPRRALAELVRLLREGEVETLRHTYKTLFARLGEAGEGVQRARRATSRHFEAVAGTDAG